MFPSGPLRATAILVVALSAACGAGEAKYPEGSQVIYCTNVVNDCDAQAEEQCPKGFTVLHTEHWTSDLGSRSWKVGVNRMPVRHTSMRIMCAS